MLLNPLVLMEFQFDAPMDLDFMEEVFLGEELFGVSDRPNPSSLFDPPSLSNILEIRSEEPENRMQSVEERSSFSLNAPSLGWFQTEEVTRHQPVVQDSSTSAECSLRNYDYHRHDERALTTSKERLDRVFKYFMEFHREGNALVQIWVPEMRGDRYVLTTCGQPFRLDRSCQRLVKYRTVSTNFCFSAEVDSEDALGLPGRVFVGKVPEWTPDVRFFRSCEYPRVNHAQRYDIRGSIALPVFERNDRCCLGVVEIILTTEKINYTSDIEKICSALQAVNLGSSEVFNVPEVKVRSYCYRVALPEIKEVLRIVCESHNIPLAQTWMACAQQGRTGKRHSNENYMECVSTVDTACHVNDPSLLDFHKACSEHHLFKGQGIAGKAFLTNQPCFSSDLTVFSKTEYPLAHHARIFNLRGVVAVRLRSNQTGICDFVLEFFLPTDCIAFQEQKLMLASLSSTIKRACWSLRVVTREELEMETMLHHGSYFSPQGLQESQHLGQLDKPNTEIFEGTKFDPTEAAFAFRVPIQWDEPELMQDQQVLDDGTNEYWNQTVYDHRVPIPETTERRRAKTEKFIGLEVLQKHFAGSLKDAAKSIGVCPTTLKRICRQHGISRWPSRKIKKVSHSLRKLQSVIDSVQGAEGAFPLSSFFAKSDDAPLADSTVKGAAISSPQFADTNKELFNVHVSASHSRSTTHSQCSSSSHSCSSGANECADDTRMAVGNQPLVGKNSDKILTTEEPPSVLTQGLGLQSGHCFSKNPSFPVQYDQTRDLLRVKAIYGEEKVRLRLPLSCKLEELRQDIANRFNINTVKPMILKYLDDDSEWVLLTYDADLQECIDIYNSSSTRTIRISVHPVQVKG